MDINELHFIEDSDDEVFLARILLKSRGINVSIVHHDDKSAFDSFQRLNGVQPGSIILVDMNMPRTRGDEVIRDLVDRNAIPDAIIGMCSGSEDPADKKLALDVGAAFFAQKPLNFECLMSICSQVPSLELVEDGQGKIKLKRTDVCV